ncbi:RHS repeat-associated core domain-containing protein [Brevibacillus sp. B_LB10_24]|uniref:RHS repeat-associated core domain-containing protein n=1 Tax=Brevibacillus sp. B_LB10_24 TaxID=3380645 RepID=UPI0038B8750E
MDRIKGETTPSGDASYTYDNRGNRETFSGTTNPPMGNTTFTYDSQERLKEFTNPSGISISYRYYADGLRATKQENNLTTHYVYLNGKVIEELDDKGNVTAQNIWGNQLLFRQDAVSNKSGYYLYNSHGDVVAITDANGDTLNSYEYDSWGNIVSQQEAMSNPFKYTGEMYDNESKLYYLRARYYDPSMGRFISEDTYKGQVEYPLSLNRYTYTHNNPLNNVDPSGHYCMSSDNKWAHAGDCNGGGDRVQAYWDQGFNHLDDSEAVGLPLIENGVLVGYLGVEGSTQRKELSSWDRIFYKTQLMDRLGMLSIPAAGGLKNIGAKTTTNNVVYLSRNADDVVQYVGITNNLARRAAEHLNSKGINIEGLMKNLNRADARAVEQALIEIHGLGKNGGTLMN